MTYRFILDLHEAADPRFELEDLTTAAGGGDTSALIFVATSKHAPRFDSERSPPSGTGTSDTGWFDQSLEDGRSVAECDHFAPEWHWQVSLEFLYPYVALMMSLRSVEVKTVWRRVQMDGASWCRDAAMWTPSSGYVN